MRPATVPTPFWLTVWTRVLWPVLAIPVVGVGLLASADAMGPPAMLVTFGALVLVVWVSVWALMFDRPDVRTTAWRIAVSAAFVVLVMSGWTALSSDAGVVVPLALLACSPPALRFLLDKRSERSRQQRSRPALPSRVLLDQQMVDRRFEELVRILERQDERPDGAQGD